MGSGTLQTVTMHTAPKFIPQYVIYIHGEVEFFDLTGSGSSVTTAPGAPPARKPGSHSGICMMSAGRRHGIWTGPLSRGRWPRRLSATKRMPCIIATGLCLNGISGKEWCRRKRTLQTKVSDKRRTNKFQEIFSSSKPLKWQGERWDLNPRPLEPQFIKLTKKTLTE
jgi:hypothetical protein